MKRFLFLLLLFYSTSSYAADYAIVTIAQGSGYQDCVRLGTESKRNYCEKHGYDFIYGTENMDPSRHIYWSKILLMLDVMENSSYKWVVWLDADTLIMNPDIPLEDLIDENINFCIGYDWNGVNSGVFFVRNCEWSKRLLTNVYARTDCLSLIWPEQLAIASEINDNPEFRSLSKIVPQRLFNSYPPDTSGSLMSTYQTGDFLVHFASVKDPNWLIDLFNRYSQLVVNDRHLITLTRYLNYYGYHPSYTIRELSNEQKEAYTASLLPYSSFEKILAVGINGGFTLDHILKTFPDFKKVVLCDNKQLPYASCAIDYFKRTYGTQFSFVEGDLSLAPNEKFQLIYLNGRETQIASHIQNCRALADNNAILLVNDVDQSVESTLFSLQDQGVIEILTTGHDFMLARFK